MVKIYLYHYNDISSQWYNLDMDSRRLDKIDYNTEKILYYILMAGGTIAASVLAPKLPYELLRSYFKDKKFKKFQFDRDLNRLLNRGDIHITKDSVVITKKGKERILKYSLEDMEIKKPVKWDGKWRLVMFDIPDYKRKASNVLRHKLESLGFIPYQKSIFIFPYDCRNEIDYIREIYEVGGNVKLIVAEEIDDTDYFKHKFHLN